MPEIVACPECNGKLRVPDESLGKKVKCPKCSKTFVAEIEEDEEDRKPARPARRKDDDDIDFDAEKPRSRKGKSDDVEIEFDDDGDDDDDDGPGKKKKKKTGGGGGAKGGWKSVSLGLMLVMVSALIWAGIILINNSEGTLFYLTKNTSVGTGVTWATFLLAFVYMGVNLAGQVINLGTPGAAKSLALGTLITTGIAYIAITIGLALYYPAVKTLAFDNLRTAHRAARRYGRDGDDRGR